MFPKSNMSQAKDVYKAEIVAIDARIEALKTLKDQAIAAALENVAPDLVSDGLRDELGRPYDAELNTLAYRKNIKYIAFAESFLNA